MNRLVLRLTLLVGFALTAAVAARPPPMVRLKQAIARAEAAEERGDRRGVEKGKREVFRLLPKVLEDALTRDEDDARFVLDLYGSVLDARMEADDADPLQGFRASYDDLARMLTTRARGKTRRRARRRATGALETFHGVTEGEPRAKVLGAYRALDGRLRKRLRKASPARRAAARLPVLEWALRVAGEAEDSAAAEALEAEARRLVTRALEKASDRDQEVVAEVLAAAEGLGLDM